MVFETCVVFGTGRSSLISRGLFLRLSDGRLFSGMLSPRKSCKTVSAILLAERVCSPCFKTHPGWLPKICLSRNHTTYEQNLQMLIMYGTYPGAGLESKYISFYSREESVF